MQKRDTFDDRIRNLIALAQDESEHSRTLLFSHISDLFLQKRPMASDIQVRMLTEILKELLDQVELPVRQEIASALCELTEPPEELIDIMCEDVVEVSGPLLEKANLPDEKLIHIIRYGTETHRLHVSRRFGLSPLVRHELEKAFEEAHSSKLKYSLNELDKLAEDVIPDMDEETTANILEVLRAQKIHKSYPEKSSDNMTSETLEGGGSGENLSPVIAATFPSHQSRPQGEEENIAGLSIPTILQETRFDLNDEVKADVPKEQPQAEQSQPFDPSFNDRGPAFPRDRAANDAALPSARGPSDNIVPDNNHLGHISPDSTLKMGDASSDLNEGIWQEIQVARQETNRQHEFVRTVADWFWEVDRNGLISFISEEAFMVFGQPSSSLIGADFISLCQVPDTGNDIDRTGKSFDGLFEHRSSFRNVPFYIAGQNEEKSLWYISAIAIFDIHSGRFTGFRGTARAETGEEPLSVMPPVPESAVSDASCSGHQEEVLEEYVTTQAIRAGAPDISSPDMSASDLAAQAAMIENKEELLQNLSHEFRTPLNAIIGFSEMINMETWGPVNEQYHQNVKNILTAALQLKEGVNDVLDSARLESGLMQIQPESFSLKSILRNSMENVEAMAAENHVQLMTNVNNIDVILYNDKQSVELCLTKMLTSILKRAIGGEVFSPSVLINSNAQVRIELPLLGARINELEAEKMFDRLQTAPVDHNNIDQSGAKFTTKISAGFGLSIAQSLARMIGGDIAVHSSQGYVTHLVLTLSNHEPVA
ncbi:MAG: hypothetical protein COB54_03395 [Alphaproteobacteria bacterium]|nr:MAG: hypothetical protein COB54_03395 [Alphaproteobacteria bacterium]